MDKRLIGAIEAGGTKMVLATGYADGAIVERASIPTEEPARTVPAMIDWFASKGIAALGIAAFGPTAVNPKSPEYGHILQTPKLAWRGYDFLGEMQRGLAVPCGYDTDVNGACLGEVMYGAGKGLDNVVYITVGTGIGAGVYVGGQLIHGMLHPEAGHITLARVPGDEDFACHCPSHDSCFEGLAAGPAVVARYGVERASEMADDEGFWSWRAPISPKVSRPISTRCPRSASCLAAACPTMPPSSCLAFARRCLSRSTGTWRRRSSRTSTPTSCRLHVTATRVSSVPSHWAHAHLRADSAFEGGCPV